MSENRIEEDAGLTFSDEDFERRYSSSDEAGSPVRPAARPATPPNPLATQVGRSRNRFMCTLMRRRLAPPERSEQE